jgi:hypothetical protein
VSTSLVRHARSELFGLTVIEQSFDRRPAHERVKAG